MIGQLFSQIETTLNRCDGWGELAKANVLAAIIVAIRPQTVVEIGIYGGRSFLPMALALKFNQKGIAIGIDPWSVDASLEGMKEQANIDFWGKLDHERIYKRFLENLAHCDLAQHVSIIRRKSDDVDPPVDIDLVHVDGSHEETAYRDTVRYGANVRAGGFFVADDLGWSTGHPKRGADWLLDHGFIHLYPLGTGAVFQRVK